MAFFAKKIKYCANECSFVALLMIARKKGGRAVKFILYRYVMNGGADMIEFCANEEDNAKRSFPYGPVVFEEMDKELEDDYLPKMRKNLWQKTTGWLYEVAVGGGYQIHPEGTWIKIGRPISWKKHRKKLHLKFGELGHLFLVSKQKIRFLKDEEDKILGDINYLEGDNYVDDEDEDEIYRPKVLNPVEIRKIARLKEYHRKIRREIEIEYDKIKCLIKEIKFKKSMVQK